MQYKVIVVKMLLKRQLGLNLDTFMAMIYFLDNIG